MSGKKITLWQSGIRALFRSFFFMGLTLLLISLIVGCGKPTTNTQESTTSTTAPVSQPLISNTPATATAATPATPQGDLTASLASFGNEDFLPWKADTYSSQLCVLVYDLLIYYDEINLKYIPGLAESWETSPDALTLTYHLRKGVQFQEGWGEFASTDVKFNFQKQASPGSNGLAVSKQVASMDTPDPYTLVVHFKKPQPIFFTSFSMGNGAACQGTVSQKYVEAVGEQTAAQKPIGTGPYKLVESRLATYYKFEALESHWRLVPEFKTLTVRMIPEISSVVAMLKTKEIDLASVPGEQMAGLKTAGLATEVSPAGGAIIDIT